MRFLIIALINIALISGCVTRPAVSIEPCGPDDFLKIPQGAVIQNVALPFLSGEKISDIKTIKSGVWASQNCWDRLEKYK